MATGSSTVNTKLIERDNKAILAQDSKVRHDANSSILDSDWIKRSFLIDNISLTDNSDIQNRYWSSASIKFTDTRLGCNIGINSRPQFTRYCDIRERGRLKERQNVSINSTSGNFGIGRYYSEAIDDPAQTIYLRFGVPQFNSLTNFFAKAFDTNQSTAARTGKGTSIFYDVAKAAGTIAGFIAMPSAALTIYAGKALGYLFIRSTSKFYSLKPTMLMYWNTVNTLVNTIAINKGIFPKIMASDSDQRLGKPFVLDQEYLTAISNLMPEVFTEDNHFDLYALANKAQRIANNLYISDFDAVDKGTPTDYFGYFKKELTGDGSHATYVSDKKGNTTISARINAALKISQYFSSDKDSTQSEQDPRIDTDGTQKKDTSKLKQFFEYLDSEFSDGSQFAVFKVDHTGSVSESFGNSVAESDLSQKLNGISSQVRQARFSFAEGNIAGDMIKSAMGAVTDVATGLLSGVTFGFSDFILGLAGTGYLDIPKYWQSSNATLPRSTYTIQLISPYGNPISQIQNIYIPLAMLLAGALPLSTGKQSYTSPFICQLFDRGRCQVKLGMIESLSINRGVSNLPFDTKGNALAMDVSFSIVDLSSIMHMPVSSGSITGVDMTLDEDNILSDYLSVLAGQDLYTQIYAMPKAKLTIAKTLMKINAVTSPAHFAAWFHESSTAGALQYLTLGAFNALEGAVRGTALSSAIIQQ